MANAGEQRYHGEGRGSGGAVLMRDRPSVAGRPPAAAPAGRPQRPAAAILQRAARKQVALPAPRSPTDGPAAVTRRMPSPAKSDDANEIECVWMWGEESAY